MYVVRLAGKIKSVDFRYSLRRPEVIGAATKMNLRTDREQEEAAPSVSKTIEGL